jgi:hypothetical protein
MAVVKYFDVIHDIGSGLVFGIVNCILDLFGFQYQATDPSTQSAEAGRWP